MTEIRTIILEMIQLAIPMLAPMAAATAVIVNFLKKKITAVSTNMIVLTVSVFVGGGEAVYYLLANERTFEFSTICFIVFVAAANFMGSTYGYDKTKQTLEQLEEKLK